MYGSHKITEDAERTAFRRAEKKYKLYYDHDSKSSKKKKRPRQVDLSEVLDFRSILNSFYQNSELPDGIVAFQGDFDRPVFCLETRPGFYFIPGALSVDEQCLWIRESLTSFPQPPNRTNHNAIYGPIHDLFTAAKESKMLMEDENAPSSLDSNVSVSNGDAHRWKFYEEHAALSRGKVCKSVTASNLLRKLRWSTLGLQFDWSKLAKRLAAPAMPRGEEFHPEAAIVNYFGSGDTLGGHLDDMEADWSKPIVSMSLGCKAIFLLGGKSREDPPLAMFLQSGDVMLMAGEARECFHGVPRIFTDKENAEITPLELHFSQETDFLEYIRTSRININIRQVF
ncbi:alpha-ketoglutarate-dependent dioxygenase alkB isoform X2 [Ricinus communis]|uniref:alpha-ketoglutarate-dependent dioxygenase alkB isoform X2 n=1 Tax=Ricinus communis TaxID=3988 RepID=UPI00201A88DA|nr:alpha-ketoglutarate-dependent dioxygenase alkB isoform X2 [Ricinus communis]